MHPVHEADGGIDGDLRHDGRVLCDANIVGRLHAQAGGHGRLDRTGKRAAVAGGVIFDATSVDGFLYYFHSCCPKQGKRNLADE